MGSRSGANTGWGLELRTAARGLLRNPGFTIAAVSTLALGLAAAVSVGTWIYAVLVRPLPGVGNAQVIVLAPTESGGLADDAMLSVLELQALRASGVFAGVGGAVGRNFTLTGEFEPERVAGASVTTDFLGLLGVPLFLGRDFRAEEGREFGFEEAAILSHGLWLRKFGGDRLVVGKPIEINERRLTVVGVLPPGFGLPENAALYVPWLPVAGGAGGLDPRRRLLWTIAAPFRQGVARARLQAEVDSVFAALAAQAPAVERARGARALTLRQALVDWHARRVAAILAAMVGGVLLVACANVALLQLARGTARRAEMSLRRALGASRAQRMRPLLAQSLLLAAAGAVAGMVLGRVLLRLTTAALEEEMPAWLSFDLDFGQLLLAALLTIAVALASGLLPAFAVSEARMGADLRASIRNLAGRGERRMQGALVGGQFAVSVLLLASAGWMVGSLRALANAELGFSPRPLLTLRFHLPGDRYNEIAARADLHRRLRERLERDPGIVAAATTDALPADDGGDVEPLFWAGQASAAEAATTASVMTAGPSFFRALGAGLIAGRPLDEREARDPESTAAVINRALAMRLWPSIGSAPGDSLGRRFHLGSGSAAALFEVVGVAPDLVYEEIHEQTEASRHQVWVSFARRPSRTNALIVRAREGTAPADLAPAVRRVLAELEPHAPMYDVRSFSARLRQTYEDRALLSQLFGTFAAVTLVLATVGIAGLVGFVAARRTREIGLRMALGATRRDVVRGLATVGLRPLLVGSIAGIVLALAAGRLFGSVAYGVDPEDPGWSLAAATILGLVGALACWLPARRASGIEPSVALRAE
jgi:predicted permease